MSLYDKIDETLNEDNLFEMANLPKYRTGLPVNMWVDGGGIDRPLRHSNYRLKIQNGYGDKAKPEELIPVSIDKDNPKLLKDVELKIKKKDLNIIYQFIKDHFDDFDEFVKGNIDEDDLKQKLYLK